MASSFDRARFGARLSTRRLGRTLLARAEAGSTNDEAWDALETGASDGTVVVADVQSRGRGRAGRTWHTAPGKALALSVLLTRGCDRRSLGLLPLAAGLAVAQALEPLGAAPALKWPNDVLLHARDLARAGGCRLRPGTRPLRPGGRLLPRVLAPPPWWAWA